MRSSVTFDREIPAALQESKLPIIATNPPGSNLQSMKRHGVEVLQMQGVGHFLMMEDSRRFNSLLQSAIDHHRAAGNPN